MQDGRQPVQAYLQLKYFPSSNKMRLTPHPVTYTVSHEHGDALNVSVHTLVQTDGAGSTDVHHCAASGSVQHEHAGGNAHTAQRVAVTSARAGDAADLKWYDAHALHEGA
jgi:hypothetical protein